MILQFKAILITCLRQLFCQISGLFSKASKAKMTNITIDTNLQDIHLYQFINEGINLNRLRLYYIEPLPITFNQKINLK